MKILVVGNGAREHAICESLKQSKKNPDIINFASARNPGIVKIAQTIEVGNLLDFEHLKKFAKAEKPDFAVLGPDDPICEGAADALLEVGIQSVGPTKELAQLEGSKSFARELLTKYKLSGNPLFKSFTDEKGLEEFAKQCGEIVVKADGLCGGKGVRVQGDHFKSIPEGLRYARECLQKDGRVVIEEKLIGVEFSLLFFCDGKTLVPMPAVQDHKRAFVGDAGPNTGGMGTISDKNHSLPFLTQQDLKEAKEIAKNSIAAVQAETGAEFKGILFGGFMVTARGVRLIEWNVRFGDPESLNILPLLETDFVVVCEAILAGKLSEVDIDFFEQASVCKYIVPKGYPDDPVKNVPIDLDIKDIPEEVRVFFGSVEKDGAGKIMMKGSRAVAFVALDDTLVRAEKNAEKAAKAVRGSVFHREDIGTEKLINDRIIMMRKIREEKK